MAAGRLLAITAALLCLAFVSAYADCTNPSASEGKLIYNQDYHVLQFCNGTNWIAAGCTGGGGSMLPTSGLVGNWAFDETTGTTAADSSGSNNTGTLTGMSSGWDSYGVRNGALDFPGTGAYVDAGNATSLRITGSLTITAWVKFSWINPGGQDDPIVYKDDGAGHMAWQFKGSEDCGPENVIFAVSGSGGYDAARCGNTVLSTNRWYHLAGVYNATAQTLDVYVNGSLDSGGFGGTVPSAIYNSPENVQIGSFLGGALDDVRIYNRALTATEISNIYNANAPSLCAGVTNPGDVCAADGTVFAGYGSDGYPLYATRCDYGQTWNGSSCTGSRTSRAFNNGNSTGGVFVGTAGWPGKAATNLLIATDSDSVTSGVQPHQAAQACHDLTLNGHTDWYLPGTSELQTLYDAKTAIGNFDTSGSTGWYKTSNDAHDASAPLNASLIRFSDGYEYHDGDSKPSYNNVRCVREALSTTSGSGECANPTGAEGKVIYNSDHHVLQFCNGTSWVAVGSSGASCP